MIETVIAIEFVRAATSGRTGPLILVCEKPDGETVELFCKFSDGCDQQGINLAREVVAACLAADLQLPVPVPYLVEIPAGFSDTIQNGTAATRVADSHQIAFGSTRANQFYAWTHGNEISPALLPIAASTLLFDGIIQNPDRRQDNPNCLVKGDEIRLIDHELAFAHGIILFWKAPWEIGGLENLKTLPGRHIFVDNLSKSATDIDFGPIKAVWSGLDDERLQAYKRTIPATWGATDAVNDAVTLIAQARDRIDDCIIEIWRVLK